MNANEVAVLLKHRATPNTSNVRLLVPGSTNFADGSIYNKSPTNNGAVIGTPQLNGANAMYWTFTLFQDDRLYYPSTPITGDFCIEGFLYYQTQPTVGSSKEQVCLFSNRDASALGIVLLVDNGTFLNVGMSSAGVAIQPAIGGTTSPTLNTWNHFAYDKLGPSYVLCLNGAVVGGVNTSKTIDAGGANWTTGCEVFTPTVGVNNAPMGLSNLRVTFASRYQSAYTPPTAPLNNLYP